jgi:beta-phosphoglucomutase
MRFAAIFDVDGVLVDSFEAHYKSWRRLAGESGVTFSRADFTATFGRTSRDIISRFWPVNAADHAEIEALDQRKEAIYREIVADDFPVMEGAPALIASLHSAGFAIALGSSGPPENIELAVDRLGVRDRISAMVTGADVTRGKPDPEIFLTAAARLSIQPRRCAVIEDAPAGIVAAHAGGMVAAALLSHGHTRQDFADHPPDVFVHSLRQLSPITLIELIEGRV